MAEKNEHEAPDDLKSRGCLFASIFLAGIIALSMRSCSMDQMRSVLEVRRTPMAYSAGLIDGLALVQGSIDRNDATLRTVIGGKACVYYSWEKQREEEDDEGETRWVTVDSKSDSVNFHLIDSTGSVLIKNKSGPTRHARQTGSRYYGDYREIEHAILASDTVTAAGYYQRSEHSIGRGGRMATSFTVSSQGEGAIVSSLGWTSIGCILLAIGAVIYAVGALLLSFKQHHIMAATVAVGLILPPVLFFQWMTVTTEQLDRASGRVLEYRETVGSEAANGASLLRQALIKRDANTAAELYEKYRTRFTNTAHVWLGGYDPITSFDLTGEENAILGSHPVRPRVASVLPWWQVAGAGIIAICAMIGAGMSGYRQLKTKRLIENIPTTNIKGVVPGLTELKGTIQEKGSPISARYSGEKVVYCSYQKQRRVKSEKGKTRWETVESGVSSTDFYLEDDTGRITVNSNRAEVDALQTYSKRTGDVSFTEWTLRADQQLYVLGPAVLHSVHDAELTIQHSISEKHFVISHRGEGSVLMKYAQGGLASLGGSLFCCIAAMIVIYGGASFDAFGYFAAALGSMIFLLILNLGFMFNDLIFMKSWLERAKANLNVSLKRRADLIPNLVKVVKTALSFEKEVQTRIAQLRGDISGDLEAAEDVGELQKRFTALLEEYPQLKTDRLVVDLNNRIVAVENQLEYARTGFNAVTRTHNTRIRKFPDSIMATLMKMTVGTYFQLESEAEGKTVDMSALLETEADRFREQDRIQREKDLEAITAQIEGGYAPVVSALFCLVSVNNEVTSSEWTQVIELITKVTGIEDARGIKDYLKPLEEQIGDKGVTRVASGIAKQLTSLQGTDKATSLVQHLNQLAESDGELDEREADLIARFRDALGGKIRKRSDKPKRRLLKKLAAPVAMDQSAQQELLMHTLISLASADGEIATAEYEAIVDFVMANTPLGSRAEVRQLATNSLNRIKTESLEKVASDVEGKLVGALSTDVAAQLIQFIHQLLIVDGSSGAGENEMAKRYLDALQSDEDG